MSTRWQTPSRRSFLALSGASVAALTVGSPARPVSAAPTSPIIDLGEPVHKVQCLSSAIGTGPDGAPYAYLFVEGNPTTTGEFAVVDLRSRETVLDVRIPVGYGSARTMDVSPVTGDVYFATAENPSGVSSQLYRHRPGASDVERIGETPSGQRTWEIAVGDDGVVWAGTYPGGRLLSFDPETGAVTDHGQALPGEQYIGAIDQVGEEIWVGTQPNGRLARFLPSTGEFGEIELPDGPVASQVESIQHIGGLVFVTTGGRTYVYDIAGGAWTDEIPQVSGYGVSPLDPETESHVYVRSSATIKRYHVATGELETIGWSPNATPEAWAWVDLANPDAPGLSIAFTYWNSGRIYALHPQTRTGYFLQPTLMGAGASLVAIGAGPEGNIYAGAFLSPPGMGRWDPDVGEFELLPGTSQVEGFGTFRTDLVFGRYPQGRLYRYDPSRPWEMGTNPGPTVDLEPYEQNRPQSFVEVGDRVAVSTVPITGRHNGAVTLWDPQTNEVEVFRGIVENQTPVSLVLHDGLLYGGTSINGGYGIDPVTPEAKLFAWDPVTRQKVFETVPVPGAPTVAGLVVDEHERLWGLAGGTLFEFDPAERAVVRTVELFSEPDDSRYGNDHVLVLDHGRLFGVTLHRVFVFDRVTEDCTVLYDGTASGEGEVASARHLAMDRYGDLYFIAQATRLFRYDLPDDTTPPTVEADVRPRDDRAPVKVVRLSASDDDTGVAVIHYRVDGGSWKTYRRPFRLTGRGKHVVEYRAVDRAWNASAVEKVTVTIARR
ncbi:MAG TPA: hypothetical protein VIL34_00765 [Actinopolymorphaceae bacterium]